MFSDIPFVRPQYGLQQKLGSGVRVTKSDIRLDPDAEVLAMDNVRVGKRTTLERSTLVRGDLAEQIEIGDNCVIGEGTVLRPSDQPTNDDNKDASGSANPGLIFLPMKIGNYVIISKGSVVRSAVIGSHVYIGENCIIQQRCVLHSCCMVMPGTILSRGSVIPPFMVYGGVPGRCVGRLPPSFQFEMEEMCNEFHQSSSRRQQEWDVLGRKQGSPKKRVAGRKSLRMHRGGVRTPTGLRSSDGVRTHHGGVRTPRKLRTPKGSRTPKGVVTPTGEITPVSRSHRKSDLKTFKSRSFTQQL